MEVSNVLLDYLVQFIGVIVIDEAAIFFVFRVLLDVGFAAVANFPLNINIIAIRIDHLDYSTLDHRAWLAFGRLSLEYLNQLRKTNFLHPHLKISLLTVFELLNEWAVRECCIEGQAEAGDWNE